MSLAPKLTLLALFLSSGMSVFAAVDPAASQFLGGWVTNSMVTGWVVSLVLALVIVKLIGKPSLLPTKRQAVFESLLEALRGLFEPIVGKKAFPAAFPLLVTFFIFILVQNYSGLLPGVGTVGYGHTDAEGHFHITRALIRPFTADFNSTIALALISFGGWLIRAEAHPLGFVWEQGRQEGHARLALPVSLAGVFHRWAH